VSKLSRLLDGLLPGLMYMDPTGTMAYYRAVSGDQALRERSLSSLRRMPDAVEVPSLAPVIAVARQAS
jgi:hypothetical protein